MFVQPVQPAAKNSDMFMVVSSMVCLWILNDNLVVSTWFLTLYVIVLSEVIVYMECFLSQVLFGLVHWLLMLVLQLDG